MRLIYKNRAQVHVCPETKLQYLWGKNIQTRRKQKLRVTFKKFPIDQLFWHRLLVTVSETVWSSTNPSDASLATSRSIMLSWCCKKLTYSEATPSAESEAGRCRIHAQAELQAHHRPQEFHTSEHGREAPGPDASTADQKRWIVPEWESRC